MSQVIQAAKPLPALPQSQGQACPRVGYGATNGSLKQSGLRANEESFGAFYVLMDKKVRKKGKLFFFLTFFAAR